MSDEPKSDPTETSQAASSSNVSRRRWYRRPKVWLLILLGVFVVNLLLSVVPVFWTDRPASYVRNAEGRLTSDRGELSLPVTGLSLSLIHDGKDRTHSKRDRDYHFSDWIPCRHVAVFNLSDDPMMQTVARSFLYELGRTCPAIQQIDYYPAGQTIEPGSALPDLYFYLNDTPVVKEGMFPGTGYAEQRQERDGVWNRLARYADVIPGKDRYDLTVSVLYGTDPFGMPTMPTDSQSPPLMNFFVLSGGSQMYRDFGFGLPIVDDNTQTEMIGARLGRSVFGDLFLRRKESPFIPPLPDSLYPPFRAADPAVDDIVKEFSFKPSVIGHGLMTHNDSAWVLKPDEATREKLLARAKFLLELNDWEIVPLPKHGRYPDRYPDGQSNGTIFAKKGSCEVTVGPIPKISYSADESMSSSELDVYPGYRIANEDGWFGIRYRDRMDREKEVAPAIRAFLAEKFQKPQNGVDEDAVRIASMFKDFWKEDPATVKMMREALEPVLAKSPRAFSVDSLLFLARLQYDDGDKETAFETLRVTLLLSLLMGKFYDELDRHTLWMQAKDWGQEDKIKEPLTRSDLERFGFTEVTSDMKPQERIIEQEEPICLFETLDDGRLEAYVFRISMGEWDEWLQQYRTAPRCCVKRLKVDGYRQTSWSTGISEGSGARKGAAGIAYKVSIETEPTDDPNKIKARISPTRKR